MKFVFVWVALLTALLLNTSVLADEGFPGRVKYPKIPVMELNELYQAKKKVVIVDTRSQYEYETLRIKGAINIPIASTSFEDQVLRLREKTDRPIVFYCNGHRCMKSYLSVKKAQEAKVSNVFAFDAGIFDWTNAYPAESELLGQSPVRKDMLIAGKRFKARLLDPDAFSESIMRRKHKSMVLDVRDKFQRAGVGFYPGMERWASLDDRKKINNFIQKAKMENKTLYIYDEVGKQVRWLQYALERAGVKDYYFMEKGARAYYDMLAKLTWK
ncbi:MAG: rhodanese-like domain-containing protein [Gammaproteobacteria bacterium]|nr:rhodanese-like domain-containing protein [Gammaproteobacteria bacterium]MDH5800969.1 rhodanese-like domain-containing protein [Gammaproteobacteria bacterium]